MKDINKLKTTIKIAVLMGGPSQEHVISLKSGEGVVAALRRRGWEVEPIIIPKTLGLEKASYFAKQTLLDSESQVAFIALHGPFGEDGVIQGVCEEISIPYTSSNVQSSRSAMDKAVSRRLFKEAGIAVPNAVVLEGAASWEDIDNLHYPLIVKPTQQGSSVGIYVVEYSNQLEQAIAQASPYGPILVEEYIHGRELTVGILGDEALPVVEIRPSEPFFNFTAKYTKGSTKYLAPAPLDSKTTQAIQAIGVLAHQVLGCRHLSRTDLILDRSGEAYVLEVNTVPGFTATSLLPMAARCVDISYDELCERLVVMTMASSDEAISEAKKQRLALI